MTVSGCPLCGNDDLFPVVTRRDVPIYQNVPFRTRELAIAAPRGDLEIACCTACGFVTNRAFSELLLRYSAGYENDQTFSPTFDAHVSSLLTRLVERGGRGRNVVEIGCGRAQFLERLCKLGDYRGTGFDPAYVGPPELAGGAVRVVNEYYGEKFVDTPCDFVVCRHVIEHVPRPLDLLGSVGRALSKNIGAIAFFETPSVDWIFENVVAQDIFYEHCSYFTEDTLALAFRLAGFVPTSVQRVFGEQYLWIEARYEGRPSQERPASNTSALARQFATRYQQRKADLLAVARRLHSLGPVAVWGGGAKGVTFVNEIDPTRELFDCIVDINPRKQNRFVAGSGHEIVDPAYLEKRGVKNVVVMNPQYLAEISETLRNAGREVGVHLESSL